MNKTQPAKAQTIVESQKICESQMLSSGSDKEKAFKCDQCMFKTANKTKIKKHRKKVTSKLV